jgi:hypothetical protein
MNPSSTAFALFAAAMTSKTSVSAQGSLGQFVSCPYGEFYQGTYQWSGTCTSYPGQPLTAASAAAASTFVSDVATDPGLNGWSCYPEGMAECQPGYVIAGLCVGTTIFPYEDFLCHEYCSTPGFFAMKCVPSPTGYVPLNSGEWLPMPGPDFWGNAMCGEGSVLCGLCASDNLDHCQGGLNRGKCCKYHIARRMSQDKSNRYFIPLLPT